MALSVVVVLVLCAIKYFLAVIIAPVIFRIEGLEGMESKEVKGKGKTNNQVEKNNKSFKDINRESQCTNQP
jgi:hypothetical protein